MTHHQDKVLYTMGMSPNCKRVAGVIAYKGIEDIKIIEVDITKPVEERPKEFTTVALYGKVPTMVVDGVPFCESSVINEYLEEVHPEKPLLPDNLPLRAVARQWIRYIDRIGDQQAEAIHIIRNVEDKVRKIQEFTKELQRVETYLKENKTYFMGGMLTLVDFALAPTLRCAKIYAEVLDNGSWDNYKHIDQYLDCLATHPIIEAHVFDVPHDVYKNFYHAVAKDGLTIP